MPRLFVVALVTLLVTLSFVAAVPTAAASSGPRLPDLAPHHAQELPAALGGAAGGNWSTYLQNPGRTAANLAERTLSPSNASGLSIRWTIKSNGSNFGSPTVVNGTVYGGSWDGHEYAMNATTGHILWKRNLGTDPNCSWGTPMGVAGNAAVWNGTVFVGGGDDNWYALNASNGSVDWKVKVTDTTPSGGGYNWASPLLYHGYEYIGLASCIDSPLVQGKLLMVNLTGNHSVVHEFDFVPPGQTGGTIWTTAAVDPATNTIWIATGNDDGTHVQKLAQSIVALNATNLSLIGSWQVPGVAGTDSDFGGGVILFHDASGRPLVGAENKNGVFYALNRSNVTSNGSWRPVWDVPTASGFSCASFDGATLYLGGSGTTINSTTYSGSVEAIDPANGSVLWVQGTAGSVDAGLAYANGLVVEGSGGTLEVMNASSGVILSTLSVPSGQQIDGAPSIEGGQVYFESGDFVTHGAFLAAGINLGTPSEQVTPSSGSAPLSVRFHSVAAGGLPPYNFTWDFGDNQTGYGPSPTHVYVAPGAYSAAVTVRDMRNDTAGLAGGARVDVARPLGASISSTPTTGPAPLTVTFTGTPLNGTVTTYHYEWTFTSNVSASNASGRVVNHTFAVAGRYQVRLTISDAQNHSAIATTTVVATTGFSAYPNVAPTSGTSPLTVSFEGVGSFGLLPYTFLWSFGDGSPNASGTFVNHTYTSTGSFAATMFASDSLGVSQNGTTAIVVGAVPALSVAFSESNATQACPNPAIVITVTAAVTGGTPGYTDSWTFGDHSAAVQGREQNHTYRTSGTYDVQLSVDDSAGSTTSASSVIVVSVPTCLPGPPPTPSTASQGPPALWEYALVGGIALVAVLAAALVLWRRRQSPPT